MEHLSLFPTCCPQGSPKELRIVGLHVFLNHLELDGYRFCAGTEYASSPHVNISLFFNVHWYCLCCKLGRLWSFESHSSSLIANEIGLYSALGVFWYTTLRFPALQVHIVSIRKHTIPATDISYCLLHAQCKSLSPTGTSYLHFLLYVLSNLINLR